jgi:hypothetical protein
LCCQAVKDGKIDEVKKWLKCDKKRVWVRVQDKHGYAPVHYAAKFNHLKILQLLHKEGNAGKNCFMDNNIINILLV